MVCPFLEYRRGSAGGESAERKEGEDGFDEPRAYCTAADRFVQAMRADICNDRYDLVHDRDCEIYLEHAGSDRRGKGDGETESHENDGETASEEGDDR
ncbi:hypothetical protein OB955_11895 [Halobacteria archaeon AArc-m2/3/4]|uniref:Uncharacterized protein n=1 Tax=Natronoglomus mannanivorans TaxID=2979990 RepID=A0AAP3E308_9EURY|nr:hypothetical protein [Halobacteria archaeon AArc-xg1-1]MCU4973443.1 hypothetical protein [Halobacteria archaeon AArc-m2/3/4]